MTLSSSLSHPICPIIFIHIAFTAEYSRRIEEREALIGQLQRSKANFSQDCENLKKQQEEDSKVTLFSSFSLQTTNQEPV